MLRPLANTVVAQREVSSVTLYIICCQIVSRQTITAGMFLKSILALRLEFIRMSRSTLLSFPPT